MNGEIPSVPIITLAGVSSLSDLLPVVPLPTPLSSNKSLLFHPRVDEEATILLSLKEDAIVTQLTQALQQSTSLNVELKVSTTPSDRIKIQNNVPELLKAILNRDPTVFDSQDSLEQKQNTVITNHDSVSPHYNKIEPEKKTENCISSINNGCKFPQQSPVETSPIKNQDSVPLNSISPLSSHTDYQNSRVEKLPEPIESSLAPPDDSPKKKNSKFEQKSIELKKLSTENQKELQKSLKQFTEKNPFSNKLENDEKEEEKKIKKVDEDDKNKRKRSCRSDNTLEEINSEDEVEVIKPKIKKVEKKLVPVLEKLSVEELMETNTYMRFNNCIDKVFEDVGDYAIAEGDEDEIPSEALIPKYHLQELHREAAKLNTLGATESIPTDRTIRLLTILERNIRDGADVSPISDPNDDEDERKLFMELAMERVMRAVDASLTALYILTSPNMQKQVYLEDVIDRIIIFTKYQLHNTIYPAYDPVYRIQTKEKDGYSGGRKKRGHVKEVKEKSVLSLYTKLTEVISLLAKLMDIQRLTDNAVLHASTMGISPFFVERISDLQLASLKLVTTIFAKYEKHRKLILEDILASMARLPSSKISLRSYRLSSEEHIQMLAALVLQLVQCMVNLPNLNFKEDKNDTSQNPDILIVNKFKAARNTASNFLYVFLTKCSSKSEEIDYRPLFENFVQDLLTTVNKPEWPAAELMLSVLGSLLVSNFVNKSLEMSLRVASLDYLGVVAARLRKDSVTSHLKISTIDQIIKDIKAEESKDDDKKTEIKEILNEDERTQFLQRVLLDYLSIRGQTETVLLHARHFYLAQWYQDNCTVPLTQPKKTPTKNKKKRKRIESSDEEEEEIEEDKPENSVEIYKCNEAKKQFLLNKIRPCGNLDGITLQTYIDYSSAELIARYLASKRQFSQSFDTYLKHIITVLTETSVVIRTKAMKCLTSIVEVDPSVLGLKQMQLGVSHSFLDHSTSVREAAVDLVGKFILNRHELIPKYYDMLAARILDTGVSVRKRVIKILRDVCIECPDFHKVPEICVKIIRRVNDEEGIRKLVLEVFQSMWFTPVKEKPKLDSDALVRKAMNITDVVSASNDLNIEWFEQLLQSLFKPKEDKEDSTKKEVEIPQNILIACKQLVDCLVEMLVSLSNENGSQRQVACVVMLHLFAKIRPQLLIHHASTLQPYLSLKVQTQGDFHIISSIAKTLELVVPLIEHPSELFLSRLEEDSVKLMMKQDPTVVLSCVSCLGSIVNNVTKNFPLIRDCFKQYYGVITNYRTKLESGQFNADYRKHILPLFKRSLYVIGLLLRFFDFTDKDVIGDLPPLIKEEVYNTLIFFLHADENSQLYTLKAIGSVCIRHYDLMLGNEVKNFYHRYLEDREGPQEIKMQILNNIESYLQEEERKMIKQDQEWAKMAKGENLKEMGDVSSGMASTVVQLYLKQILEAFIHPHPNVRNAALKVVQLILAQGLVHPVQIVPYLICMSTDSDKIVSNSADKQLQDIEKKYPGFIHMKAQAGIRLSYQLQKILQRNQPVIRGFRIREGELPGALNGFLYSILRTKQQRRALLMSMLKQFDEQVKTSLSQMLYLADNMAYFPYQVQDDPLFIIHHIDIILSVTGTNLLQSFRECLIPWGDERDPNTNEDEDDESEEELLQRMPEDTTALQQCITASQGCLLLLVLKNHLKTLYGFNDAKITQYSPTDGAKVYDKNVSKKAISKFNPKAVLLKLKEGTPPAILDEDARRALITEYLEFKTLIMNLDPDDQDDDDDVPKGQEGTVFRVREFIAKKTEESEEAARLAADGENATPKVPKLTIIATRTEVKPHRPKRESRKPERHKKHKRKRKIVSSDDSDDASDPDYLA